MTAPPNPEWENYLREMVDLPEAQKFDEEFLHNFGDLDPIPVGARALCGAVSTRNGPGEIEPLVTSVCPICLSLTPHTLI